MWRQGKTEPGGKGKEEENHAGVEFKYYNLLPKRKPWNASRHRIWNVMGRVGFWFHLKKSWDDVVLWQSKQHSAAVALLQQSNKRTDVLLCTKLLWLDDSLLERIKHSNWKPNCESFCCGITLLKLDRSGCVFFSTNIFYSICHMFGLLSGLI